MFLKNGVLRKALALAAIAAAASFGAALNAFTDDFSGATLNARWGELTNATLSTGVGHNAPGSIRFDGRAAAASASLQISAGPGWVTQPSYITFWATDSLGGSVLDVHIDEAQSGANGVCGWWNYVTLARCMSGVWSSPMTWEEEMFGTLDSVVPDWGNFAASYGGTFRSNMVTYLSSGCPLTNNLDTNRVTVVLIWRISITGGVVFFDDWTQAMLPTSVKQTRPVAKAPIPLQDIAQTRVYLPNGQVARNGVGSMPAGCYVVRNNGVVRKLVLGQ